MTPFFHHRSLVRVAGAGVIGGWGLSSGSTDMCLESRDARVWNVVPLLKVAPAVATRRRRAKGTLLQRLLTSGRGADERREPLPTRSAFIRGTYRRQRPVDVRSVGAEPLHGDDAAARERDQRPL